jgi:hypothetical protein
MCGKDSENHPQCVRSTLDNLGPVLEEDYKLLKEYEKSFHRVTVFSGDSPQRARSRSDLKRL